MSFFGSNPGFGQTLDPFAGLERNKALEDDDNDGIDFEDTYDGLGDQLDEANDDFNNDTFGGDATGATSLSKTVGKDFDFFGQTAKVSDAITEEQVRYTRQQAPPKSVATTASLLPKATSKPVRTGYEKYKEPSFGGDLQVDPSLWGTVPRVPNNVAGQNGGYGATGGQASTPSVAPTRKMMSLEEVEAAMQAAKKGSVTPFTQPQPQKQPPPTTATPVVQPQQNSIPQFKSFPSQQNLQAQRQLTPKPARAQAVPQVELQPTVAQNLQNTQRQQPYPQPQRESREQVQPRQILRNPTRQVPQVQIPVSAPINQPVSTPGPGPVIPGFVRSTIVTHPLQVIQMSDEERAAYLLEEAKRAKRNHKIYLLSKDNGLMTPQDKNFITRIQLQQLMTATGNVNDQDPDAALAEDFYYQVHSQIRGGPRQNPHQPLSHFAQTYLFQTGGRQGGYGRRQQRGGDNHMQRMEQQVQRAVEAAKLKPKNKQLVIEGSLGKISFSNAKTPKPLLNIKRNETSDPVNRPNSAGRQASGRKVSAELSASDRKTVLRIIENVYSTLMKIEDHERREPPPPSEDSEPTTIQQHMEWRQKMDLLNATLWDDLKVMEPINPASSIPHPFIAILTYPKGKKAIPRVFRHMNTEQKVTMVTIIVIHLDILDVIRLGQILPGEVHLPPAAREGVELFTQVVMPSLIGFFSEAPLEIVIGMLGLILDRVNVRALALAKTGLGILTLLLSRAEIVKQAGVTSTQEWEHWSDFYQKLFDLLEPILPYIFPGTVNTGEDIYVWQFLAAVGINASPEQQQRLVIAVKDRVMGTVMQSKTLPPEMASQKLGNVNLFMRAIGLDVELLG
ncbi:MAG: hypothetical protein MMC33_001173 [Icmadophila ericetorum]|nr:hypothetical protein [Icmadophila ericetorum]